METELAEAVAKVIALGGSASTSLSLEQKKTARKIRHRKYRDPETGTEWSGQGTMPSWIEDGRKEQFLNPAWIADNPGKAAKSAVKASQISAVIASVPGSEREEATQPTVLPQKMQDVDRAAEHIREQIFLAADSLNSHISVVPAKRLRHSASVGLSTPSVSFASRNPSGYTLANQSTASPAWDSVTVQGA
ncbi:H-NS family nucleoid-associated regulatory protein [Massilia sp. ST3]|uniref:H-NS family nucleoid-associated regulatory protein n=1 Tax=Massilia sp. ST3 TaxID=2824903 RepID=UPI0035A3B2BA